MKTALFFTCLFFSTLTFSQQEINPSSSENKPSLPHSQEMEVLIYPNPVADNCRIQGEEGASCTVYSSSGIYIGKWVFDNSNTLMLDNLPSGVLQAIVEKNGIVTVKKIIVL